MRSGVRLQAGLDPRRVWRSFRRMPRNTAIKLGGLVAALLVMCLPLFFWPSGEAQTAATEKHAVVVTVPPVAVVPSVLSDSETTTTLAATGAGTTAETPVDITIAATGDIIIHQSLLQSAYNRSEKSYDFRKTLAPVAPYLAAADYTVVDLESRLAGGSMARSDSSLRFNAPNSLTDALKICGVDLAATANNHSDDFGWLGIVRTLDRLDRAGIAHVGTYRSQKARDTPFMVDIKGIKVAFLNYTQFINAGETANGHEAYAVNLLDVDKVAQEAMAARLLGADVVIAILHYGQEYSRTPTQQQTGITEGSAEVEGLLSRGVDVILGAHPHVVEPIVKVLQYSNYKGNDTYAAYSLGNFLTGQRWRYTDSGIVAYVHIQRQGLKTRVTGISYLPVYVQKSTDGSTSFRVLPVLPGVTPQTDTVITPADETRMNQVWDELENQLYRPDEGIVPLDPASDLGLATSPVGSGG